LSDPTGEIVPIIALAAISTVANFAYTGIQYNIELWEARQLGCIQTPTANKSMTPCKRLLEREDPRESRKPS
jgi:hypothetical protein